MIFESRDLLLDDAHWCIVLVREEGVFFISGTEGFSKAETLEETEWRRMPLHGNRWLPCRRGSYAVRAWVRASEQRRRLGRDFVMFASEIKPGVVYRYTGYMSKIFAVERGALYLVVRLLESSIPGAHEFMHLDGPYAGRIAQTPILLVERWIRNYEVLKDT